MVILLDTNVIISALFSPAGPVAEIVSRWEMGALDSVISDSLLSELRRALQYPKVEKYLKLSPAEISSFLRRYAEAAVLVKTEVKLDVIGEDPDDNRVLECAITGGVVIIVSGDKHLLALKEYKGIVVLSPAGFLAFLDSGEG